jgi:hypothetical protein
MPGPPLDPAIAREALKAHREHGSQQKAAAALGLSRSTLQSRLKTAAAMGITEDYVPPPPAPILEDDGPERSTLFDERWDKFTKWIGRSKPAEPCKRTSDRTSTRRIIFQTCDWHEPFINESAFQAAVEANRDADICMVGGDALNASAFSRFIETTHIRPQDEFERLTRKLQLLAQLFPEVHVNIGNHPERLKKYFGKRLDPWAMFLVVQNPIEFVVNGLRNEGVTNIHVAKPMIDELDSSNWGTFIGDAVFTHGETHGKLSTRPAENVARWMRRWERKLPTRPRVVIQEHNHRAAMFYDEELQALLIQAPCLSQDVAYQTTADIKYSPNQTGYTRLVQDDGCTLINESRFYLLDESGEARVA